MSGVFKGVNVYRVLRAVFFLLLFFLSVSPSLCVSLLSGVSLSVSQSVSQSVCLRLSLPPTHLRLIQIWDQTHRLEASGPPAFCIRSEHNHTLTNPHLHTHTYARAHTLTHARTCTPTHPRTHAPTHPHTQSRKKTQPKHAKTRQCTC